MSQASDVLRSQFWERYTLQELNAAEWEALCDGCGRCCLHKLEDEDSGHIAYTNVACKLLDLETARCSDYAGRQKQVPDCVRLSPQNIDTIQWLPASCAYRRLQEGRGLASWHPLISGTQKTVESARISVIGRVLPETAVNEEDLEEYVIRWVRMR